MKLAVKKTYCPKCQRLVREREQRSNNRIQILCSRCGAVLWDMGDITWRYMAKSD